MVIPRLFRIVFSLNVVVRSEGIEFFRWMRVLCQRCKDGIESGRIKKKEKKKEREKKKSRKIIRFTCARVYNGEHYRPFALIESSGISERKRIILLTGRRFRCEIHLLMKFERQEGFEIDD